MDKQPLPTDHPLKAISMVPATPGQTALLVTSGTLACELLAPFYRPQWEKELIPPTLRTFTALLAGINLDRPHGVFLGTVKACHGLDAAIGLERLEVRVECPEPVELREGLPFLVSEAFMGAGKILLERALKPEPTNRLERECARQLGWPRTQRSLNPRDLQGQPWGGTEEGNWVAWTDLSEREQLLALAYYNGAGPDLDLLRPDHEGRDPRLQRALVDDSLFKTLVAEARRERERLVREDRAALAIPVPHGEPTATAIARLAQTFNGILARLERRSAEVRARDAQLPTF